MNDRTEDHVPCSQSSGPQPGRADHHRGCGDDDTGLSRTGRAARGLAGIGFLALAGAITARRAPAGVDPWPFAIVPAWFGVSHLVAGAVGYRGCPELGAIPSVLLGRRVETGCGPWERFDRRLERG